MSKELTEQWRNGTLEDGFYYVKENNEVFISPCSKHYLLSVLNDCEVLAPVPDYNQFVELTEKVEGLRELIIEGRFVEALKVLGDK